MDPNKVEAIIEWNKPTSASDICKFWVRQVITGVVKGFPALLCL